MSFSEAVLSVVHQYANFQGRARRSEYWYFALAAAIVNVVISLIAKLSPLLGSILSVLVSIAIIVPNLAVMSRRLHDIGKSGLYILFVFIPIVGLVLLIVWLAQDSQPGANEYGVSPKYPNGIPYGAAQSGYQPPYSNHTPTSGYQPQYQPPQYPQPQHQQPAQINPDEATPVTPAQEGIVCPMCGARNVSTSKFCTTCGNTLVQ